MTITPQEEAEYELLADKRIGGLTTKEHKRYLVLLEKVWAIRAPIAVTKILDNH